MITTQLDKMRAAIGFAFAVGFSNGSTIKPRYTKPADFLNDHYPLDVTTKEGLTGEYCNEAQKDDRINHIAMQRYPSISGGIAEALGLTIEQTCNINNVLNQRRTLFCGEVRAGIDMSGINICDYCGQEVPAPILHVVEHKKAGAPFYCCSHCLHADTEGGS